MCVPVDWGPCWFKMYVHAVADDLAMCPVIGIGAPVQHSCGPASSMNFLLLSKPMQFDVM